MNTFNIFLASIYSWSKRRLKNYDDPFIYFAAKTNLCLLVWLYSITLLGIITHLWNGLSFPFYSSMPRAVYVVLLAIMYFLVNSFSEKINRINEFICQAENQKILQNGRAIYIGLMVIGFLLLVSVARYYY